MKINPIIFCVISVISVQVCAETTYFDCKINEPVEKTEQNISGFLEVSVKFAVENLNSGKGSGALVSYPGTDEESGPILVSPTELPDGKFALMTNLNSQGGSFRVLENGDLKLWGDGDGFQFTDFVLWTDGKEKAEYTEGYVRDYGPAYESTEPFKQFIKCKKSKHIPKKNVT